MCYRLSEVSDVGTETHLEIWNSRKVPSQDETIQSDIAGVEVSRLPKRYSGSLSNSTILVLSNDAGGLYLFRKDLFSELLNEGNRIIAAVPPAETDVLELLKQSGVNICCISVDRRGLNPITDLKLFFNYCKLIQTLNPDFVITYTIKPNVYGGLACRLHGVPYASNVSGLGSAFQRRGLLKLIATNMYAIGTKNACVVFFENASICSEMVELGVVERDRTHVLAGAGVNLEHFSLAQYPSDCKPIRFLFLGRVMKEKGLDELLEAVKSLWDEGNNILLEICGAIEEAGYIERLKGAESSGWLQYHGNVDDVRPYIANCHCIVLPSWHEGMANVNLESAAMGRPVITSDIPGCIESIEDGVSGFSCIPKNTESIKHALKKFLNLDYSARKEMGLAGRERMELNFDKRLVVADTLRVIEEHLR